MRRRWIEVIHNGLDPASFPRGRAEARQRLLELLQAPASAVIIGTVGRLAFEKDQETFLRVFRLVRRDHANAHAVLVGHGERRAALERLAGELGIRSQVTFLGERSDARRLVAGFDLFVLTSRSEGFPNVLLEATFLGVPCVATNIAGNPDVLGLEESLFPAGDVVRGAERVLAALADMPRTLTRTEHVRCRALELFTSERSVGSWLDLYRRQIAARSASLEPAAAAIQAAGAR
jgi:glycosyltransferase involved in cell wall biosynthesis